MNCKYCCGEFEYDEVHGNFADGYVCFECAEEEENNNVCRLCNKELETESEIKENSKTCVKCLNRLFDDLIDGQMEESKFLNCGVYLE